MRSSRDIKRRRAGISWLELQAACAMFGIMLSGLAPFTVMYLKQVGACEKRLRADTPCYLLPSADPWARKLGAAATVTATAPETAPSHVAMPISPLEILSFDPPFADDELTVTVSLTGSL